MKMGIQYNKIYGMQQKQFYIAINAYLKKQSLQINNLTLNLRELEKEEQIKLKFSRRKEVKISAEINDIGSKEIIEKIDETKSWFSEMIKLNL